MIRIKKGEEPKALLEYRQMPGATYADMRSNVKEKVLGSLMAEQGYLCAYCMCRIGDVKHPATIEHCKPQSYCTEAEKLDYKNMAAVCLGNRDAHSNKDKSCDAKRGTLSKEKQKMEKINLYDESMSKYVQYKSDGTIFSEDSKADEDLNERLNLNCAARRLKECRLNALRELQRNIRKKYPGRTVSKKVFQEYLTYYYNQEEKTPFCGIIIAWLQKKV